MRSRLGASPDEMASLLGVTLATIYKWEAKRGELPALGLAQKRLFLLITQAPSEKRLMQALRTGTWHAAWAYLMAPLKKGRKSA
jgi:predicted DNA-binding transcriptional regulator AlpA